MLHPQRLDDVLPSGAETLARGGMNQADPGLSSVWAGTAALGCMGVKVGWEVSDLPWNLSPPESLPQSPAEEFVMEAGLLIPPVSPLHPQNPDSIGLQISHWSHSSLIAFG